MNHDDQNENPALPQSLPAKAAQLRPAVAFGLRVAVLAGVAIGAGLTSAHLSAPVDTLAGTPWTMCCIATEEPSQGE